MAPRLVVLVVLAALAGCSPVRRQEAVGRCVARTSRDRTACHRECEDDFSASFLDCYGATPCTTRCQGEHAQCQDAPARALQACEGDAADPRSCRARVDTERGACRTAPRPAECEEAARARGYECWEACQRTHEPALQRCAARLKRCLDGCIGGGPTAER